MRRTYHPRRARRAASSAAVCALALLPATSARASLLAPLVPDADTPDLVLRRADWIAREPLTLEEILRQVPGIAVARNGGQGSAEMVTVLGSPNGRVEWVLDGIEITSPELAWPRLYAIPLGIVDRIEFYRMRQPPRIAIWTREGALDAAAVDFDLGRGHFDARTRRVQFLSPQRVLEVGLAYDEVLRSEEEFRTAPTTPILPLLGAFDARAEMARLTLRRGGDVVRLLYVNDNANTHASILDLQDVWRTEAVRAVLRWDRTFHPDWRFALVAGHQAWDHQRTIGGVSGPLREARTHAGFDLGRPGAWPAWLRVRTSEVSADGRATGDDRVALRYLQSEAEVEVGHEAVLDWSLSAGWVGDERAQGDVTVAARAATDAGAWRVRAEAGRGVVMAGYGATGAEPRRRGEWVTLGAARSAGAWEWSADAFVKTLRDRLRATGAFFPGSGGGPERLSGLAGRSVWRHGDEPWRFGVGGGVAWTPDAVGDRAGLAEIQGSLHAEAEATLRSGDLTLEAYTDWTFETERRWGETPRLAPSARGDVGATIGFLRRIHFFYTVRNLADVSTETYPGVRLPIRTRFLGLRVRVID